MAGAGSDTGSAFEHTVDITCLWLPCLSSHGHVLNDQLKTIQVHGNSEDQPTVVVYK